jgi:hypothetical protein
MARSRGQRGSSCNCTVGGRMTNSNYGSIITQTHTLHSIFHIVDSTKSTAHSVENDHAWKQGQCFWIRRWFYRYRVLFDKVVSIVCKSREHAFIIWIWRYIWGHSCERFGRGGGMGTIAEMFCCLFLSPLSATIRLIRRVAVIRSSRWRNMRHVHASYEYGWWLDAQIKGNICEVADMPTCQIYTLQL